MKDDKARLKALEDERDTLRQTLAVMEEIKALREKLLEASPPVVREIIREPYPVYPVYPVYPQPWYPQPVIIGTGTFINTCPDGSWAISNNSTTSCLLES